MQPEQDGLHLQSPAGSAKLDPSAKANKKQSSETSTETDTHPPVPPLGQDAPGACGMEAIKIGLANRIETYKKPAKLQMEGLKVARAEKCKNGKEKNYSN